jgi:phenylacetate-CoA ligase
MDATNFNEKHVDNINDILTFVLKSTYSSFYREKFGSQNIEKINSYTDFKKIPFLRKDEILAKNVDNRKFLSDEEIIRYSFSSGTTNNNIPTIIPHASYQDLMHDELNKYSQFDFKKRNIKKILILLPPNHGLIWDLIQTKKQLASFVIGDIHNLKFAMQLISTMHVDGIVSTPTLLDFLVDEHTGQEDSFKNIKWISLGAESCSTARFHYFKLKFPNALFQMRYGNSELGGGSRNYRCEYLTKDAPPNLFHLDASQILTEIINEDGNVLSFGEVGEIVVTDVRKKAFPLIRYKLGDMGSISQTECLCGNNILLTIDGRAGYDVLKINGTIIRSELIAKEVAHFSDILDHRYQMHIYEEMINEKPKLKLELHLKLKTNYANKNEDAILVATIIEKISSNLRLSNTMTLSQLIEKGIFMPLNLVFVDQWEKEGMKTKNIISHII